ncbi:MAG: hypothetical protein ACYDCL_10610 [Myxococcales bacterium]
MRWAALVLGCLVGCRVAPHGSPPVDAGPPLDAGDGSFDAGFPVDAGAPDAGPDGGALADAGADGGTTPDAGPADAGPLPDAGAGCAPSLGGAVGCSGSACPWAAANPGDVVPLGSLDPAALPPPALAVAPAPDAGTLVFSDDPETVGGSGVLYRDTVGPGPVRLFVYHVNGGSLARKISVVLENASPQQAVTVAVKARALAGPSTNYLYTGKVAVQRWLSSAGALPFTVPTSQAALLDSALDGTALATGELINAIYDLALDGPLTVSVVSLQATTDTLASYTGLTLLAGDGHQRGTFWPDELVAAGDPSCPLDTSWGALDFPLPPSDSVHGTDATTGQTEVLDGQYGVLTRIDLSVTSSDGRSLALLLDPRGGAYGGAASVPAGLTAGGIWALPSATDSALDQGIVVGRYAPQGQPEIGPLVWTLSGGSSAPVDLLLVPY